MQLAVLTYEFVTEKPIGMPDAWPAQIVEIRSPNFVLEENWIIMTDTQLAAYKAEHQAAYNTWESAYFAATPQQLVTGIVKKAKDFGNDLADSFATRNVLMGITQAGKTRLVTDYCHKLSHYMSTGSLYAAIEEINALKADLNRPSLGLSPFVTDEILDETKYAIQDYLGIPRT